MTQRHPARSSVLTAAPSVPGVTDVGAAKLRTPTSSSRRDLRARSMSRQTRAVTVVSQLPRFSTPLLSERASRNQVS